MLGHIENALTSRHASEERLRHFAADASHELRTLGRFVRADHARSRSTGSAGLGLAIVQAVITAHGGTTVLRSRPGCTTIRLTLPI